MQTKKENIKLNFVNLLCASVLRLTRFIFLYNNYSKPYRTHAADTLNIEIESSDDEINIFPSFLSIFFFYGSLLQIFWPALSSFRISPQWTNAYRFVRQTVQQKQGEAGKESATSLIWTDTALDRVVPSSDTVVLTCLPLHPEANKQSWSVKLLQTRNTPSFHRFHRLMLANSIVTCVQLCTDRRSIE